MTDLTEVARDIFVNALQHCSISEAFARTLELQDFNGSHQLVIGGDQIFDLSELSRVRVIAIGKAASPMLDCLLRYLPSSRKFDLKGILISTSLPPNRDARIQAFAGGHPLPNQNSFEGARAILSMLESVSKSSPEDTLCIFLISGGASAMMELPIDPSISLEDTISFHQALIGSGANIVEMNCVRKHFSAVKGGRLAHIAGRAKSISLLISDVPPAHLDALASGPTLPDHSTISECREIIDRYELDKSFPETVRRFFASPDLPETPKVAPPRSHAWTLLGSEQLASAAERCAATLGFHTVIDNSCDDWPCERAAEYLLNRVREIRREHPRTCLISCGEISVKLPTRSQYGTGGRNQQFALYAATELRREDSPIAILSAGSDGVDGNSNAAGAVVSDTTILEADTALKALKEFDSFTWLDSAGATIITGPTGQNLRDLRLLLTE